LNSSAVKIVSGSNATDSANWDSSSATSVVAGVLASYTYFVPGLVNTTSYLLGVTTSGYSTSSTTGMTGAAQTTAPAQISITGWRKRTINSTTVATGSDTTEASVTSDTSLSTTIFGSISAYAVAPGYLALLTTGVDGSSGSVNYQVYITLIAASPGTATQTKLTTTSDVVSNAVGTTPALNAACTTTTFTPGNVFYDIGSGAFFFTYAKTVITTPVSTVAGTCGSGTLTYANTIYLQGIYLNGTFYWSSPISVATATPANPASNIFAGNDNWLNSSNIYIIYKDTTSAVLTTYYSKTTKSTTTSALGSFSSLIKDPTVSGSGSAQLTLTYTPVSVWASNYTYGITLALQTATGATSTTYAYTYTNFINGSTSGVDSGLSNSGATGSGGYFGYQLTTGYSVLAYWQTNTVSPTTYSYTLATYYGNATVNQTAKTIGSVTYKTPQFYEDGNGTYWIGWIDIDTVNGGSLTYNAFLGALQGQLNVVGAGILLPALYAFILLFVAIFAL
jgi:hypothetical protein